MNTPISNMFVKFGIAFATILGVNAIDTDLFRNTTNFSITDFLLAGILLCLIFTGNYEKEKDKE